MYTLAGANSPTHPAPEESVYPDSTRDTGGNDSWLLVAYSTGIHLWRPLGVGRTMRNLSYSTIRMPRPFNQLGASAGRRFSWRVANNRDPQTYLRVTPTKRRSLTGPWRCRF